MDIRRPRRSRKGYRSNLVRAGYEDEQAAGGPTHVNSAAGEFQGRRQEPDPGLAPTNDSVDPRGMPMNTLDISCIPSSVNPPRESLQGLGILAGETNSFQSSVPLYSVNTLSSIPLDGFYTYFFPAHPFVLPPTQLACQCDTDPDTVSHLVSAMALIGALYTRDKESYTRRQDVEQMLEISLPSTGFTVQTLMLLALCLEWSGEGQRAGDTLQRAKDIALDIGMNQKSYAVDLGAGNPVLEESWRRTWWELYVIDALFAGIRHWPTFSLWKLGADVHLPADEKYYVSKVPSLLLVSLEVEVELLTRIIGYPTVTHSSRIR